MVCFSVILELLRDTEKTKYSIWIYNRQWNRCTPVWQTKEQCYTIFKSMFHFSQSWCSRFSRISQGSWQVRFTDNKEDVKIYFCWIPFGICTYLSDAGTEGGPGGPLPPPQYFADQLTLFEPGRADFPHLLLLPPPQCFSPSGITVSVQRDFCDIAYEKFKLNLKWFIYMIFYKFLQPRIR